MWRERRCWGQAPAAMLLAVLVLEVSYAQQQQDHYKVAALCVLCCGLCVCACVRACVRA
jgi:hypothetical protein